MLKIDRLAKPDCVVFALSGRIDLEHVAELQAALDVEHLPVVLDMQNVKLVDRDAVRALARWASEGVTLEECPAYVREWIAKV